MINDRRIYLYDSTLRDGAQTQGIDFSVPDKMAIARELDRLGIDYVEGGWPGANPTDDAFFQNPPTFKKAKFSAFGMTRRSGRSAENDPGLQAVLNSGASVATLVGKSWDFQVTTALSIDLDENIRMIKESFIYGSKRLKEMIFDAEHFFDGYQANPDYALSTIQAAYEGGARWIVLCDTNGGSLPEQIYEIIKKVTLIIPGHHLGIHCHNDSDNAVANSLAAVRAGARHIQATINGLGERCGNANLISIIPNLMLKMGFETGVTKEGLTRLRELSRTLDERLNRPPNKHAPYVGESAFAHKGGLHVAAVEKDPRCYEHIDPKLVGNNRHIVVSDQSGRSNILARFRESGIHVEARDPRIAQLIDLVKQREFEGYAYDGAEASFELLAKRYLLSVPDYFQLLGFRVVDERRMDQDHSKLALSEATIKATIKGKMHMEVAEGNGPVSALDAALRKLLTPSYPSLSELRLIDYKVRILNPQAATGAVTRVIIESADGKGDNWSCVGVSTNVIDASYNALHDSITYKLLRDGVS
jgi:2-isopropylmalate synthase